MTLHTGSLGSDLRVRFRHLTMSSEIVAASCPRYAVASSVKAPPWCSVWSFLGGPEQKVRLLRTSTGGVVKQLPLRLRRGQLHGRLAVDRPHPSRACHPGHFPLTLLPRCTRASFASGSASIGVLRSVRARLGGHGQWHGLCCARAREASMASHHSPHIPCAHTASTSTRPTPHTPPAPRTLHPYSTPPHPAALLRLTLHVSIR